MIRKRFLSILFVAAALVLAGAHNRAMAATAESIRTDSQQALRTLYATHPLAKRLSRRAKAVLVFPKIVKAGLIFGGSYGEGELQIGHRIDGYYNSVSGSWGLQAGAQTYGYVLFLMSDKALRYLRDSHGWEIGVGPTVTVINEGAAKNLSTSTLQDDAYAFIFDQQGLMAGISLEGSKITRIER